MVVVKYPICGCEYQTGDLSSDVVDKQDKLGNLMLAGDPWLMAKSKSYVAKLMELIAIIKVAIGQESRTYEPISGTRWTC